MEKYFPEGRRLVLFRVLFGILFTVLSFFLVHRQLFQYNQYKEQERKQGQRRIIRPGPRGDIFDRNGKLLIGNKAHFSAKLHLGSIDKEIWTRKKDLRNSSLQIKDKLKQNNSIQVNQLITDFNYLEEISNRFVRISGKAKKSKEEWLRVMLYFQGNRLPVEQDKGGDWYCNLPELDSNSINSLEIKNIEGKIGVNLSNLLTVYFPIDTRGKIMPALPEISNSSESFWNSIFTEEPSWEKVFSVSNSSITWEARLSVVQEYTDQINNLIGRNKVFELRQLIRHWREQLLLPIELASDLKPIEYATLVEEIDANSPISVQAEAIRHYPLKDLASHVLGYVGSGYEAKPDGLSGSDLATFEIKGRKGKGRFRESFR
jgi:cell division protein FtsI/penicillin-binding protein 2